MAFEAKKGNKSHRSHTVEAAISEATKDNMVGLNINISPIYLTNPMIQIMII